MCLILFSFREHPKWELVLLANRDEFHDRPAAPMTYWSEHPQVLAGRDMRAGGTWLGLGASGRFGAITNFREGELPRACAPSRGRLVVDYLVDEVSPRAYLEGLAPDAARYAGFNMLVGDRDGLWYGTNRGLPPKEVAPGVHGLSNHLLDTPWPKVERGTRMLANLLAGGAEPAPEALFAVLADRERPLDEDLPETGVGLVRERELGPIFIATPNYGTRSSTLVLVDRSGAAKVLERTWPGGEVRAFELGERAPQRPV